MVNRFVSGTILVRLGFVLSLAAIAAFTAPVLADDAKPAQAVRSVIIKPLQAAKQAIDEKRFADALARLQEADAVSDRTPYENGLIEQMRVIAAVSTEQPALAAQSYDALDGLGALSPQQRVLFAQAIGRLYFSAKDPASALKWFGRYFAAGGTDLTMRMAYAQAYYLADDFPNALKAANEAISAYMAANQKPPSLAFEIISSCAVKLNDLKLYQTTLERLVALYPKVETWQSLLNAVANNTNFGENQIIDFYRLKSAVGYLTTAKQFIDYADLASHAGLAAEAKSVLDKGFASNILGQGADAAKHTQLLAEAKRAFDADQKTLATAESEASKAKSGDPLVNAGVNFYGYGQYDKAVKLIEAGIAKGGLKAPEDAKLHLGIALYETGDKAQAVETFKSVTPGGAVGELARLWILKATENAAP